LKTKFVLATLILFALPSLFADTVILVALPSELNAVRKEVRVVGQPAQLAGHKVSVGYHKGEKICIAITGAGNLNSAMITQTLLTRYKVDRVISIGVAGNLNDGWKVGDLLIATDVINHQQGKETPAGFETKEQQPSTISRQISADYIGKCEDLRSNAVEITRAWLSGSPAARTNDTTETLPFGFAQGKLSAQGDSKAAEDRVHTNAAAGIPRQSTFAEASADRARNDKRRNEQPQAGTPTPPNIREGKLVSGESFIASSAKRKWLRETFHADAVDMVSAGIARVCEANGVPYVIIRALSDNADEFASEDFARFVNAYKEPATVPIAIPLVDRLAQTPSTEQR
jgi:nucleoside phosphorylase